MFSGIQSVACAIVSMWKWLRNGNYVLPEIKIHYKICLGKLTSLWASFSSSVLSSVAWVKTDKRTSISDRYPFLIGEAALRASWNITIWIEYEFFIRVIFMTKTVTPKTMLKNHIFGTNFFVWNCCRWKIMPINIYIWEMNLDVKTNLEPKHEEVFI